MKALNGEQRITFLENQGRFYAGTGYYSDADAGFVALSKFKPLQNLEFHFGQDFADFSRGFNEVHDLIVLIQLTKQKAQADNSMILKELNGKGLTFLQEKVGRICSKHGNIGINTSCPSCGNSVYVTYKT